MVKAQVPMDRLQHLNSAQREAVQTLKGPLLILAGAGTGKTRVITYRMAELIRRGAAPDRILSVTFTNKAAREMHERATTLLGNARGGPKPHVSTFHSLCVGILRREIPLLGYPATFAICDRGDQESTARKALRDIRVPETSIRPVDLLALISRWKMAGFEPPAAADAATNDQESLAAAAYRRYQSNLKASASVDFDDLLFLTSKLFDQFPEALARHQARFDFVQIDEYQDTNGMQFSLIEALVRPHKNLCVVGDDDQSIYGWRGAELRHILGFQNVFPGTKIIRLQDNYRCTNQILELANRLVRHNVDRHDKQLVAHKFSDSSVRFAEFPDELKEAEGVVRDIAQLIGTGRAQPGSVAILFRTNEQPRPFETELRRLRLPYVVLGSMSFFDRREIRDMLAYLKVLSHPDDEISLLRIINTPSRGIGGTTVEKVLQRAVRDKLTFWNAVPHALAAKEISKSGADALAAFSELLARYRARLNAAPGKLAGLLHDLVADINYESEIEKDYKEPQQQLLRVAMIEELIETLRQYEMRTPSPTLAGFLDETALVGRDEGNTKEEKLAEDGIKLMTMHSAKGLEFSRVYLVGMEEGLLPHQRSIAEEVGSTIAEERRLAYVGVTRAKDFLTLTRAATRMKWGKRRPSQPSRFLFEMRREAPAPNAHEVPSGDVADVG